jgi:hypothetical protein
MRARARTTEYNALDATGSVRIVFDANGGLLTQV